MQAAQNGELAQEAVPKVHLHASDQVSQRGHCILMLNFN